ncbi:MAG TPA: hypothetical protein VL742_19810 [Casimicrobiaceae bacterium]|nr:hypothetical protein [Casimicrobiaceae bacterium]
MQGLARYLGFARKLAQTFGPYLLVEILLPGGSLIALALFVYRQKRLPFGLELGAASARVRRLVNAAGILFGRMSIPGFAVRPS